MRMVTSYNSTLQTIPHQNKEILNQVSIIPSQDRVYHVALGLTYCVFFVILGETRMELSQISTQLLSTSHIQTWFPLNLPLKWLIFMHPTNQEMIIFMYPQIRLFNKHNFFANLSSIYYVLC
jgi:hypothetical protein